MGDWIPEIGSRVRIDHRPSICHDREGQLLWLEEYGYCVLVDAYDVQGDGVLRSPLVEVQIGWLKPPV
ncbi:hypothetical protein BST81_15040 [Leptolyngbya sp. 'hensonii']|uniref:hypothetical protein n=1 Tax=Leptolyngbya sp. 'hensonii' TaxID=1922337 RepID=UPI00095024DA|nr:hypothetical protein [Leptolyngbya sp. 'hensonii']OLP17637.1 hypothetical protein BST81_15040 [Leptolyngbya sp. 'hensonii']